MLFFIATLWPFEPSSVFARRFGGPGRRSACDWEAIDVVLGVREWKRRGRSWSGGLDS